VTSARSARVVALALGVGIIVVDQTVKAWAVANLEGQPARPFIGELLRLDLVRNPGAAFSLGTGSTLFFTILSAIVSVVLLRLLWRTTDPRWALAFGALVGGALGNLTDRLTRDPGFPVGHVVDMFRLPNFPVFNIADIAITLSVATMMLLSLRGVEPWERVER
jgi:signal peptidase II